MASFGCQFVRKPIAFVIQSVGLRDSTTDIINKKYIINSNVIVQLKTLLTYF